MSGPAAFHLKRASATVEPVGGELSASVLDADGRGACRRAWIEAPIQTQVNAKVSLVAERRQAAGAPSILQSSTVRKGAFRCSPLQRSTRPRVRRFARVKVHGHTRQVLKTVGVAQRYGQRDHLARMQPRGEATDHEADHRCPPTALRPDSPEPWTWAMIDSLRPAGRSLLGRRRRTRRRTNLRTAHGRHQEQIRRSLGGP